MGAFASFAAAETRARAKVLDGTWIKAHATKQNDGTIAVRVQRKMSPAVPDPGSWVELTDDAVE
ncbi:hypothetical protein MYX04_05745 [Nitrospiraceae bacterium AH_259_D15_M11_P09]|nr:hypothetical protein [Nitrospiraceae bacterium AH_259_D15_M11_P09]